MRQSSNKARADTVAVAGCRANGTLGVSRHSRRVIAGTLGVLAAAGCRANGNLANARSPSHSLESTFSRFQAPSSTCWRPACCRACCRRPHRRSNSGRQQAHKTQQNVRKHKTRGDKLWMACVCSDESGPQATHATVDHVLFLCGVCIGRAVNRRVLSVWFVRMILHLGGCARHKVQSVVKCHTKDRVPPNASVLVHRCPVSLFTDKPSLSLL